MLGTYATISGPVVSIIIGVFTIYIGRKRRERQVRDRLSVWRSNLASNERVLTDSMRKMDRLEVDERPLDELASRYPDLGDSMTDLRAQIREHNGLLGWFADFAMVQGKHLQGARPSQASVKAPRSVRETQDIRSFADAYLTAIDLRRKRLLLLVQQLKADLKTTMERRNN